MKNWDADDYMNFIRIIFIAVVVTALALLGSGCVSDKVVKAVAECNASQIAQKSMRYQAMQGKMDAKDVTINILADALAGDPCAQMMIAEINGKNRLANSALLGGLASLPYISNWRNSDQNSNSNSTVTVNAQTGQGGAGSEGTGGASGTIDVNVSGGGTNTGTNQRFDKGILGGTGSINDADTVNSDGLF